MKKFVIALTLLTLLTFGTEPGRVAAQTLSDQVLLLLSRANTWTATQTFTDVTITGTCTGCGGAGGGTVTSVGLSTTDTTVFSVTGSPVVGSGTLDISLDSQAQNLVLASPAGGAGVPVMRALVDADIPDVLTLTGSTVAWGDLDLTGSTLADLVTASAADLTSGALALARLTDNDVTAGIPLVSGAGGDPSYTALDLTSATAISGQLAAANFPILTGDVTTAGGSLATTLGTTGVTANSYGSSTLIPTFTVDAGGRLTAAADVAIGTNALLDGAQHSDTVAQAPTRGSLIYVPVGGSWDELVVGTANQVLTTDGTDAMWGTDGSALTALNGTNVASGLVGLTVGGSNKNMTAVAGGIVYTDADSMEVTAAGTASQCLLSNGAGAPSWGACATLAAHNLLSATHGDTLSASVVRGDIIVGNSTPAHSRLAIGAAGTMLRSDGTDVSWSNDGSQLTLLNATNITQGTLPLARLSGITNTEISSSADIAPSKVALSGATFGTWRTGTATWDPASIADGDEEATTFSLTGVTAGDVCIASHTQLLTDDLVISAHVSAADTAKAVLANNTGLGVDLASGTLRIVCMEIS